LHAEFPRRVLIELFHCPDDAAGSLGVEQTDDPLHLGCLVRQRAALAFAGGIFHVPAFGHQPEEAALKAQRGFHSEVRQVVQREEGRVTALLLPRNRAIVAGATEHSAAVRAFDDLNQHLFYP
jgi:hypothetical protein